MAQEIDWVSQIPAPRGADNQSNAIDDQNNIYLSGQFSGIVDFDLDTSVFNIGCITCRGSYVAKYSSTRKLQYANQIQNLGFFSLNFCQDMHVNELGEVLIMGWFKDSIDADPGPQKIRLESNGYEDIYLIKFDSIGDLLWAKSWGGKDGDVAYQLEVDQQENIYLSGYFADSIDFNPSGASGKLTAQNGEEGFLLKLDSLGKFEWVIQTHSNLNTQFNNMSLDVDNNVVVAGSFSGTLRLDSIHLQTNTSKEPL